MAEKEQQIQEMQMLEQNLHNTLLQKQAFQMELSESEAAQKEVSKSDDDVFKIIGQLMIKTKKADIEKELEEKKKLVELRMKTLEKQEKSLMGQLDKLREEVMKKGK